jgi:pentose-5-phosphate-3-epimerase
MPEASSIMDRLSGLYPTISVGVLTADLASLGSELRRLGETGVALAHFDVMDGVFSRFMWRHVAIHTMSFRR